MSQEIAISCIVCTWCGKTLTAIPVSDKAELVKQIHEHELSCENNPLVKRIAELEKQNENLRTILRIM